MRPRLRPPHTRALRIAAATTAVAVLAAGLTGCTRRGAPPPNAPILLVANHTTLASAGDSVAVVDGETGDVLKPLTLETNPVAMASVPGTGDLVAVNRGSGTIDVVSVSGLDVTSKVHVGLQPDAVAVAPNGQSALVANYGDGTVVPVNLGPLRSGGPPVVGSPIRVGSHPAAVAISPDGATAVVADFGDGTLDGVDLAHGSVTGSVQVGREPDTVTFDQSGDAALVGLFAQSEVIPVYVSTMSVGSALPVAGNPVDEVLSTGGQTPTVYVVGGNAVTPIQVPSDAPPTVGAPLTIGPPTEGIEVNATGTRAWVSTADGMLDTVDLSNGDLLARAAIGGQPGEVLLIPSGT